MKPVTVSYSEMQMYSRCRREFYYNAITGRRPVKRSHAMSRGTYGHECLKFFWQAIKKGATAGEAIEYMNSELKAKYPSNDVPLIQGYTDAYNYLQTYVIPNGEVPPADKLHTIVVEEPMQYPISPGLAIGFTADLLVDGRLEDSKFIGRMWSEKKTTHYNQIYLYAKLLQLLGYEVNELFIKFIKNDGEIRRKKQEMRQRRLDNVYNQAVTLAHEIAEFKRQYPDWQSENAVRTFNNDTCTYCAYAFPCSLEADGKSARHTWENEYETNKYGYEKRT